MVRHSPTSLPDLAPSYSNRRTVPRYTFIAVAEISTDATQECVMGTITEISRKGCYVGIENTLPLGSLLSVVISRDHVSFVSQGKVIYAHQGIGMGIVFLDPPDDQLKFLDAWLAECSRT
jgi:hypothetical protein